MTKHVTAPTVSVFMPTYNYGHFIKQAVQSVLQQSYTALELVISDNASNDETQAAIEYFAAQDKRVKYFRNAVNVGLSKNFNLAVERCHPESDYLILLPADDWWETNLLENLVDAASKYPEAVVVYCDGMRAEEDGGLINKYTDLCKNVPAQGVHCDLNALLQNNYVPIQAALLRRYHLNQLLPNACLFDPDVPHSNDLRLWLQLMCKGGQFYFLDKPLARIRKHPAANTSVDNLIPRLTQEALVFEKTEGICPEYALDTLRFEWASRYKRLGFLQLQAGHVEEARIELRKAGSMFGERQLDILSALALLRLPLPTGLRTQLWKAAVKLANSRTTQSVKS